MPEKGILHKRVLGIVGSPRRGGNTEMLVDTVLRSAEEAGALAEKVILSKLDIRERPMATILAIDPQNPYRW